MKAAHAFEEHTGEVRLVLSAPTREGIFEEACRGMGELMLGQAELEAPLEIPVVVTAPDQAALLAEFLNELVFQSEITRRVFVDCTVRECTDRFVRATARGVTPSSLKTAVKAATLHDLTFERANGGFRARVILDV